MSASLVGSEMCIRDRSWSAWRVSACSTPSPRVSWLDAGSTQKVTWSGGPVSYTHLTLPTICSV
eukprot:11321950-Alexandrium_andersonii.AAC.1